MDKELQLSERFLKEASDRASTSLVGKVCKRMEINSDLPTMKLNIKELIYEAFRDFHQTLLAYDAGYEASTIVFKSREKKHE